MPIHQEVTFKCNTQRVFEALTDSKKFSDLTGMPAEIDAVAGGRFYCFDGMITGLSIEVLPNSRLVQAWRVGNWEDGVYSIVKFELETLNDSETKLVFDHTGFPEEHKTHLAEGWHERYWEPMKQYLEAC